MRAANFTYDKLNRRKTEETDGRTTQFFYDAVGNRTRMIDPDSRTTYYTYDKVNRLTGIEVDPDSKSADYYFDAIGNITKEIKPNSAVTYYEYDDAGKLTKLENVKSDSSLISSYQYDRDKAGNMRKCHRGDDTTVYYEYDKAQRLTSEVWKDSGMSEVYSFKYDYDGVGNRTKMLKNLGGGAESTYYCYDAANKLDKEWNPDSPSTAYFGYNDNGSVTRIHTASGTTYFEYNDSDLVKKITYPDASTNEFYYDGRNQRVVIKDSDGAAYFQWDGLNPIEEQNPSGCIKYLHGYTPMAGAGSLAYSYFMYASKYQIPHKDHIGSTKELTDTAEIVVHYYKYDAFGTELEDAGSEVNRFQFAANYMELKDLENVYLSPSRVYYADIGRFLQKDPAPEVNPYYYANNRPVALSDPTGWWPALRSGKNILYGIAHFLASIFGIDLNRHGTMIKNALGELRGVLGVENICIDAVLYPDIDDGNMRQDEGANLKENQRHRTMRVLPRGTRYPRKDWRTVWRKEYDDYVDKELDNFEAYLAKAKEDKYCHDALISLGLVMHSAQDFFSHAVRADQDGGAPPREGWAWWSGWDVWTMGMSGHPGLRDGDLYPSTYPEEHPTVFLREVVVWDAEFQTRAKKAQSETKGILKAWLPHWLKKCRCWCLKTGKERQKG